MVNPENPESKNIHPDRPIECTECQRPIVVHYTEIADGKKSCIGMCSICPQLSKHLQGITEGEEKAIHIPGETGLACGECGTSLDAIRMGTPLGCSHCYEVFGDIILSELLRAKAIPQQVAKSSKTSPLHLGRQPGEAQELSPSLKLIALNEALAETLREENYEQAAWLRDQIKQLTEKPENSDGQKE